jgi:hypothetical protein
LTIAHNDCVHTLKGVAPSEVIFGRNMNLPGFDPTEDIKEDYNPKSYAQKLKWILSKTQEIVLGKMEMKKLRNKKLSQNITTTKFTVGQAVRLWQPVVIEGKKAKLTQKWFGPYFITNIKHEGRVIYLKDDDGIDIQMPVSVNRIWPYPQGLVLEKDSTASEMAVDQEIEDENSSEAEPLSSDDEEESDDYEPPVHVIEPGDSSDAYEPSNQTESSDSDDLETVPSSEIKNNVSVSTPKLVEIGKGKSFEKLREIPIMRARKPKIVSRPLPKLIRNKRDKNKS